MKGGHHEGLPPELREQLPRNAPEKHRKIEQVWRLLGHLEGEALNVPDTDAAWAALAQRLDTPDPAQPAPDRAPVQRSHRRMRVALAMTTLVVVLVLGAGWWLQPVEVVAPPGTQRLVTLPDGSTAHLNSDSRLRYRRGFLAWPFVPAAARTATLDGEAFFVVTPGVRPFVVETFNARAEVLGTQFNVRARQGPWEDETRVTLASGRVRVTARQNPEQAVLLAEAGHGARVVEASATSLPAPAQEESLETLLVWRQQGFVVVEQPLAFILAEVERRYAVSIGVEEGVALTDSMSLFYPRGAAAEQIIREICLVQRYRYRQTSNGFALFAADL